MYLHISLQTNALGENSWKEYYVSPDQLEQGVNVVALLPRNYQEYVGSIYCKTADDGLSVNMNSSFGDLSISTEKYYEWKSREIGLSYAWCKISINFIPYVRYAWDTLRIACQGVELTFRYDEIKENVFFTVFCKTMKMESITWLYGYKAVWLSPSRILIQTPDKRYFDLSEDIEKTTHTDGNVTFELLSSTLLLTEWDEIEDKPVELRVDEKDFAEINNDAEAAYRVAEQIEGQQPELLEIIADYMSIADELGSKDAHAWLVDYYEQPDSQWDPYV